MQETELEVANIEEKGWFEKIKNWSYENWQTVLVILIVLIIGTSAYNYNMQGNNKKQESTPIVMGDIDNEYGEENSRESKILEYEGEAEVENKDQEVATEEDAKAELLEIETNKPTEKEQDGNNEKSVVISNDTDSGKIYIIEAKTGEGITHLARRAIEKYIQETGEGSGLTQEHKIYIEDYMQNRTGENELELGNKINFSENLIKEAILNSTALSSEAMENLKQYTQTKILQ